MLIQILLHTPLWVWALLAMLLWLGWSQARPRRASLARTAVMPVAMAGLSLYGTLSAFGARPAVLAAWLALALPVAWAVARTAVPAGTRYLAAERRFDMPGSWLPMALILAIFGTKYCVGVALTLHPGYAQQPELAIGISALYGLLSGVFAGRALRLRQLVLHQRDGLAAA